MLIKKGYGQALGYSNFHNAFLAPSFAISRKSVIDVCNFRAIYPESVTPNPRMVNYLTQKITKPGLSTTSGLDKLNYASQQQQFKLVRLHTLGQNILVKSCYKFSSAVRNFGIADAVLLICCIVFNWSMYTIIYLRFAGLILTLIQPMVQKFFAKTDFSSLRLIQLSYGLLLSLKLQQLKPSAMRMVKCLDLMPGLNVQVECLGQSLRPNAQNK